MGRVDDGLLWDGWMRGWVDEVWVDKGMGGWMRGWVAEGMGGWGVEWMREGMGG